MKKRVLYWKNRHDSGSYGVIEPGDKFDCLKAKFTYDYHQGGMARFYVPVKEILGLKSVSEVLNLFKDGVDKDYWFNVTVEEAVSLAGLFHEYSEVEMEYLKLQGLTDKEGEEDRKNREYKEEQERKAKEAWDWHDTLSKKEKGYVNIIQRSMIATAG